MRRTSWLPSLLLCAGRKWLQLASVSVPCLGVGLRKASMAPVVPRRATDAVPGSVLIGVQPGGYASVPAVLRATFQLAGAGAGCSQENACDDGPLPELRPAPSPPTNPAATKPIATTAVVAIGLPSI